jgi:hypothetical protein
MNKQKLVFNLVEYAAQPMDLLDIYTRSMRSRFGTKVTKSRCRSIWNVVDLIKRQDQSEEKDVGKITARLQRIFKSLSDSESLDVYLEEAIRLKELEIPANVLLSSLLSTAVADFEFFFAEIFRKRFMMHPEILSDKTITLKEVLEAEDTETVISVLAEKRISDLMYGPYESWIKELKDHAGINIEDLKLLTPTIKEAIGRRNAYVHNNGKVNKRYLQCCVPSQETDMTKGDVLQLTGDYIVNFLDYAVAAAAIVSSELSRKLETTRRADWEKELGQVTYELNLSKRYRASVLYGPYAKGLDPEDEYATLVILVNDWVARKKDGDLAWRTEVEHFSTSEKDDMFKMAKFALLENSKESQHFFLRLLLDRKITEDAIFTWPLLEEVRPSLEKLLHTLRQAKNNPPRDVD